MTGALGDCCDGDCPLSFDLDLAPLVFVGLDLAPLLLAKLEDLGLVLHMIYKYFPLFYLT